MSAETKETNYVPTYTGVHDLKLKYWSGKARLCVSHYIADENFPAIQILEDGTGERISVASVYIDGRKLDKDTCVIKDYSENEGVAKALLKAGLISEKIDTIAVNRVVVSIHHMQGELLDAWHLHQRSKF